LTAIHEPPRNLAHAAGAGELGPRCTVSRRRGDYIDLGQLHQFEGASRANIHQLAAIELPSGERLDGAFDRGDFVRSGLKRILEESHFIDGEEYIDALPAYVPP